MWFLNDAFRIELLTQLAPCALLLGALLARFILLSRRASCNRIGLLAQGLALPLGLSSAARNRLLEQVSLHWATCAAPCAAALCKEYLQHSYNRAGPDESILRI